jgi:hypothetical protein
MPRVAAWHPLPLAIPRPAAATPTTRRTAGSSEPWPEHWRRPEFKPPKPPRESSRPYKRIESFLFRLPADLVDAIAGFDLRRADDFRRAHELADTTPADEDENAEQHQDRIAEAHRDLWRLREDSPLIAAELNRLAAERCLRAEEVQRNWTVNHEIKANNFYLPPLEYKPIAASLLIPNPPREILER